MLITVINASICVFLTNFVKYEGIIGLGLRAIICVIIPNVIYALVYLNISELRQQSKWVLSKLKVRR